MDVLYRPTYTNLGCRSLLFYNMNCVACEIPQHSTQLYDSLSQCRVYWLCGPSARSFLRPRGLTHNFWWATRVRFFWLRIVHFALVWLWYMIRQFRIHVNFLQFFVSSRGPSQGLRPTRNCGCCGTLTWHWSLGSNSACVRCMSNVLLTL